MIPLTTFSREADDHVAFLEPAFSAGLPGKTLADQDALGSCVETKLPGDDRGERRQLDADAGVMHLTVLDQHVGDARWPC